MTLLSFLGSLDGNQLCGLYEDDDGNIQGTYTTLGITKLCEGLKGSAVTSLKCATTPEYSLSCQRPLTLSHSLAAWLITCSAASL